MEGEEEEEGAGDWWRVEVGEETTMRLGPLEEEVEEEEEEEGVVVEEAEEEWVAREEVFLSVWRVGWGLMGVALAMGVLSPPQVRILKRKKKKKKK